MKWIQVVTLGLAFLAWVEIVFEGAAMLKKTILSARSLDGRNNNSTTISAASTSNDSHTIQIESTDQAANDGNSMPSWMSEYIAWHQDQISNLTLSNWDQDGRKYLIQRCLKKDRFCGGLGDRIGYLPHVLRLAAHSQRIILIVWERPAPLEEFLLPHQLNWTAPDWFRERYVEQWATLTSSGYTVMDQNQFSGRPWDAHAQEESGGDATSTDSQPQLQSTNSSHPPTITDVVFYYTRQPFYDHMRQQDEPTLEQIYHVVWNALFQPHPRVQAKLEQLMKDLGLLGPKQYDGLHLRMKYERAISEELFEPDQVISNLTQCALNVHPIQNNDTVRMLVDDDDDSNHQRPLFIASDASEAAQKAISMAHNYTTGSTALDNNSRTVAMRPSSKEPLHLDRGNDYFGGNELHVQYPASDYDDLFVDLLLLANARCITAGVGGYGRLAAMIGGIYDSCFLSTFFKFPEPKFTFPESCFDN